MFQRESELLYLISFIKTFPAAAAAAHAQVPNNSNGRIVLGFGFCFYLDTRESMTISYY